MIPASTTPAPASTFADRIKILIQRTGSVTEIARRCGFSEGVVRSWRDGNTDPSRARCVTLARTLNVSLVWLVAGEGPMLADGASANDAMSSTEITLDPRTRTRHGMEKLGQSPTGMDSRRLDTAMRILQSELDLADSKMSLSENADMLADLYSILSPNGGIDASAMLEFNHRLSRRVRNAHPQNA